MTDQQNYESNHEKESLLEENVQPPIVEQDQQKHVPTSVILSLAFYLALSYLSILLCFTVALGALGIILLAFLWLHLLCFMIATVLLWNGKNKGNKTTLYIASALYFVSMIAAYDPEWEWSPFFFSSLTSSFLRSSVSSGNTRRIQEPSFVGLIPISETRIAFSISFNIFFSQGCI